MINFGISRNFLEAIAKPFVLAFIFCVCGAQTLFAQQMTASFSAHHERADVVVVGTVSAVQTLESKSQLNTIDVEKLLKGPANLTRMLVLTNPLLPCTASFAQGQQVLVYLNIADEGLKEKNGLTGDIYTAQGGTLGALVLGAVNGSDIADSAATIADALDLSNESQRLEALKEATLAALESGCSLVVESAGYDLGGNKALAASLTSDDKAGILARFSEESNQSTAKAILAPVLAELGVEGAAAALAKSIAAEDGAAVSADVCSALKYLNDPSTSEELLKSFDLAGTKGKKNLLAAARDLSGFAGVLDVLAEGLEDSSNLVQIAAKDALVAVAAKDAEGALAAEAVVILSESKSKLAKDGLTELAGNAKAPRIARELAEEALKK